MRDPLKGLARLLTTPGAPEALSARKPSPVSPGSSFPWRHGLGEDAWNALSAEARRAFLSNGPLEPSMTGSDELVRTGFAEEAKGCSSGCKLHRTPVMERLHDWLARIGHVRLLGDQPDLLAYVTRLLDWNKARALAQSAASRAQLSDRIPEPHGFLAYHVTFAQWPEWSLPPKKATPQEKALLEVVKKADGKVRVRDLPKLLPGIKAQDLDKARLVLMERLVLFHDLDPQSLEIELGLLSVVRRANAPKPRAPLLPLAQTPALSFEGALLHDDLVAVLLELAREPARLKIGGQIFQKHEDRLMGAFEPLPGWLMEHLKSLGLFERLRIVIGHLRQKGFVTAEERLAVSAEGRAFLARPRHARIVELFPAPRNGVYGRGDEDYYGAPATSIVLASAQERKTHSSRPPGDADREGLRAAVRAAFAGLEAGRFYRLGAFLDHATAEGHAPLLRGAEPERVAATMGHTTVPAHPQAMADASRNLLSFVFARSLFPHGGVSLARDGKEMAFALTPFGRHYLGLEKEPPVAPAEVEAQGIVQPNFDVVLLSPSPGAIAELSGFTERSGGGAGDHARTFKITKKSVTVAARAGLAAETIVATLARLSKTGVPDNVARAVRDWAGSIRHVSLARELVLECKDAATLAALQASLGEQAEPLSFALRVKTNEPAELVKRLEKEGIVVATRGPLAEDSGRRRFR